ncbi:MAG: cytochrome-c peroxidase [Nitrospirae bacterium]|nr:MAG: cytochrome-c peroxidase [Nitrospirota bacterium]
MRQTRKDRWRRVFLLAHSLMTGLAVFSGMSDGSFVHPQIALAQSEFSLELPLGLDREHLLIPQDNPLTHEKVTLGKFLFFDTRLSANETIACASCHKPALAFTDGQPVSTGIHRQQGGRSAPAAINRAFSTVQFWDGRAATLEEQALGPFVNPVEHGFATHDQLVAKVQSIAGYRPLFQRAFGSPLITKDRIGQAIASFQRTLLSGNSPYDQFTQGGREDALSARAKKGMQLFFGKGRCFLCHTGPNFTDERFHNLGVGWDGDHIDLGRYTVTKAPKDIGAFKTPTLREIARTAPYMHDGRFATLEQVVEFYNQGGIQNPFLDPLIQPLNLSQSEQADLVEFLWSLNGEGWEVEPPTQFPQ